MLTNPIKSGTMADNLKKLVEAKKYTAKELSKRLDVSTSTMSLYLANNYKGDTDALDLKVAKFLENEKVKEEYQQKKISLDFVKTSVSNRVYNVAKLCQNNGEMGICFGSSGLGKTTACRQYQRENYGVIFIDPDENTGKKEIVRRLAQALNIEQLPLQCTLTKIEQKLRNSDYLVIVDESENLRAAVFRLLRKIHDRCNYTFGLLFVGTERLYYNVSRMRGEFEYLTNRISVVECLEKLKTNDMEALIRQVFPNATADDIRMFEMCSHSNARELFNVLKRTNDLVKSGHRLEPNTIKATRAMLIGGI